MKAYNMAWRNIWRNKARTLLTASIVFIVVILSTLMSSQQYGMYDQMINNLIELSGHLQIQDTAFLDKKIINHSLTISDDKLNEIESLKHVNQVIPRIESFALASFEDRTKGIAVIGVDPEKEKGLSKLDQKIIQYKIPVAYHLPTSLTESKDQLLGRSFLSAETMQEVLQKFIEDDDALIDQIITDSKFPGHYLHEDQKGILIGEKLAQYLEVTVGDSIVCTSQGYHGITAADIFVINGLLKLPMPDLERRIAFISLNHAQTFYSLTDMFTTVSVILDRDKHKEQVKSEINALLPPNLAIQTWEEQQPEMVQMIESDKAGGVFMKGIFYMIISFIIFGTIVMMMSERKREFGIIISIGMQKPKVLAMLFFETLYVSLIGTLVGLGLSFPIVTFMHHNPIPLQGDMAQMMEEYGFEAVLYFSNSPEMFYWQALTIFIIAMVVFIFPLLKIRNLNAIKAVRS